MKQIKRWWSVRGADHDGQPAYLIVAVDNELVHISVATAVVTVPPERIERIRQVLHEARAAALWDRGSW
ncbi:MAG: hypothetical protein L0K86_16295 [Actinomycetia bacterium]|nr:hypothetical protein [Actinomycetes bacterium]